MHKAILMVLLAVVSSSAAAEWVALVSSERSTGYVEPATIRNAGDIVKMWDLLDLKTAHVLRGKPYMSVRSQREFDCKEERTRGLAVSYYSGNMAGGELVAGTDDPEKWRSVPPGTMIESLWKFACGKK